MGIIQRQSIKTAVVSYAGIALGLLNNLFLFPNFLSAEVFGLTRLLFSVSDSLVQLASWGAPNILTRYFPDFKDPNRKHNGILSYTLLILTVGFILVTGLCILFQKQITNWYAEESALFVDYYYYLIPLTFFLAYYRIFQFYSRSLLRIAMPNLFYEVFLRLFLAVTLLTFIVGWVDEKGFLQLFVLAHGSLVVLMVAYLYRLKALYIFTKPKLPQADTLRQSLVFGGYTLLFGASGTLLRNLDIMMLGALSGLANTAIYSVAFFASNLMEIPRRSLAQITAPIVVEHLKHQRIGEVKKLYKETSINQLTASCFIFLMIWVNLDFAFSFLPENFSNGRYVILFIGLARLFDQATGINTEILMNSPYFRVNFWLNIITLGIGFITNYLLIPIYGINGAALATLLTMVVVNLMRLSVIWWFYRMQPFSFKTLWLILLTAALLLSTSAITGGSSDLLTVSIQTVLLTAVYGITVIKLNISATINGLLFKLWDQFRKNG